MEIKPHKKIFQKYQGANPNTQNILKKKHNVKLLKPVCNATMEPTYIYKKQANLKRVSILSRSPNI